MCHPLTASKGSSIAAVALVSLAAFLSIASTPSFADDGDDRCPTQDSEATRAIEELNALRGSALGATTHDELYTLVSRERRRVAAMVAMSTPGAAPSILTKIAR